MSVFKDSHLASCSVHHSQSSSRTAAATVSRWDSTMLPLRMGRLSILSRGCLGLSSLPSAVYSSSVPRRLPVRLLHIQRRVPQGGTSASPLVCRRARVPHLTTHLPGGLTPALSALWNLADNSLMTATKVEIVWNSRQTRQGSDQHGHCRRHVHRSPARRRLSSSSDVLQVACLVFPLFLDFSSNFHDLGRCPPSVLSSSRDPTSTAVSFETMSGRSAERRRQQQQQQ